MSGLFIGGNVEPKHMVSRSLEKMILIAIGLSTAVIIGIPVLMYSIDTLSNASQADLAHRFADRLHNVTGNVDDGIANNTIIEINVPEGVTVSSAGMSLTVSLEREGLDTLYWANSYSHTISLQAPTGAGAYVLRARLVGSSLEVTFDPILQTG